MTSQLTLSVLNNLAAKAVCGDPPASASFTGFLAVVSEKTHNFSADGTVSIKPEFTSGFSNASQASVPAAGGVLTTTGTQNSGGWQSNPVYIGDPIPYTLPNTAPIFYPNTIPSIPLTPWPGPGLGQTFIIKPDLESLEEGVHEIKGGKVIIKKIMVSEEQLEEALKEELGHDPSDEEKATLRKEIEEISASEEREV